jgi:hypothetical protein
MKTGLQSAYGIRTSGWTLALVGLSLLFAPMAASAQEARPIGQAQAEASAAEKTDARIVLVEWRIKKGREQEFLEYWSKQATIADRSGLIGEFLSRVEDRKQFPWMVWDLDKRWTTFVNVGFWRSGDDFHEQIGRFINNAKPPLAFEAQKRRRVFVAPERWRVGASPLMISDHSSVK